MAGKICTDFINVYNSDGNMSAKVDIKETTYEAAQRVDSKLNIEMTYLENPSGATLSKNAQTRFSEKRNLAILTYSALKEEYSNVSDRVLGKFTEFIKNYY